MKGEVMKIRYYTEEEIKILSKNIFVNKINYKRVIEYDFVFKLWCVMMKLDMPELTGKQIFSRAGFNTSVLHNDLPHKRINSWIMNYKKYGIQYFVPEIENYCSINKQIKESKIDDFKQKLLKKIIERLKEIENEQN